MSFQPQTKHYGPEWTHSLKLVKQIYDKNRVRTYSPVENTCRHQMETAPTMPEAQIQENPFRFLSSKMKMACSIPTNSSIEEKKKVLLSKCYLFPKGYVDFASCFDGVSVDQTDHRACRHNGNSTPGTSDMETDSVFTKSIPGNERAMETSSEIAAQNEDSVPTPRRSASSRFVFEAAYWWIGKAVFFIGERGWNLHEVEGDCIIRIQWESKDGVVRQKVIQLREQRTSLGYFGWGKINWIRVSDFPKTCFRRKPNPLEQMGDNPNLNDSIVPGHIHHPNRQIIYAHIDSHEFGYVAGTVELNEAGVQMYRCLECNTAYLDASDLLIHMNLLGRQQKCEFKNLYTEQKKIERA